MTYVKQAFLFEKERLAFFGKCGTIFYGKKGVAGAKSAAGGVNTGENLAVGLKWQDFYRGVLAVKVFFILPKM